MRPVDHVRDAWRVLRRSPRELPLVLAVLSIGVGALSAAYVVGETLFFKPLPYPHADRLVRTWNGRTDTGYRTLAAQEFAVLLEGSTLLAAAAPYAPVEQRLGDGSGGDGNRLRGLLTTPRLFEVLGVSPSVQWINLDEAQRGATPPIVVSERLRRTGMVRGAQGELIYLDGLAHELVAVMPADFWFPDPQTDYWLPLLGESSAATAGWQAPVVARLSPAATPASAGQEVRALFDREGRAGEPVVQEYSRQLVDPVRPAFRDVQRAVGFLAVLIVANLGWVFVARARRLEQACALRGALGSPPSDAMVGRVLEAAMIGVLSVPLAMLIAWAGVRYVTAQGSAFVPRLAEAEMTGTAVLVALIVSLVLMGLASVPALGIAARAAGSVDLLHRLTPSASGSRAELALMAVQAALVVTLTTHTLALVLGLDALLRDNVGFARTDAVVVAFAGATDEPAAAVVQIEDIVAGLQAGGVRAAATSVIPLSGRDHLVNASLTRQEKLAGVATMVGVRAVTTDYFGVLGFPLSRGRGFADDDHGAGAVIVNEALARHLFGSIDVVGRALHLGDADATIVGVVRSIRHRGLFETPRPEAYVPYRNVATVSPPTATGAVRQFFIVARDAHGTEQTIRHVTEHAAQAASGARLGGAWHFRDLVRQAAGERPLVVRLVSAMGGLAVLLMGVGCYGMFVLAIRRREREMAIRMSLGASPGRIVVQSLRPAAMVCVSGCALGTLLFVLSSRLLGASLPGADFTSGSTTAALLAWGVLVATVLLAVLRPLWMAARVDPVHVLR